MSSQSTMSSQNPSPNSLSSNASSANTIEPLHRLVAAARQMKGDGQTFYSPSDNVVSPCTAKLNSSKKKHFNKGKPTALFNAAGKENAAA